MPSIWLEHFWKEYLETENLRVSTVFSWTWTLLVPIAFLAFGIWKKDLWHIRSGILLLAASLVTLQYYTALNGEVFMLITGTCVVLICWYLLRRLRPSYKGYTSMKQRPFDGLKNREAFSVGEAYAKPPQSPESSFFRGGSGGGGGASGHF